MSSLSKFLRLYCPNNFCRCISSFKELRNSWWAIFVITTLDNSLLLKRKSASSCSFPTQQSSSLAARVLPDGLRAAVQSHGLSSRNGRPDIAIKPTDTILPRYNFPQPNKTNTTDAKSQKEALPMPKHSIGIIYLCLKHNFHRRAENTSSANSVHPASIGQNILPTDTLPYKYNYYKPDNTM